MDRRDSTEQLPNISAKREPKQMNRRKFVLGSLASAATGTLLGKFLGSPQGVAKNVVNSFGNHENSLEPKLKKEWGMDQAKNKINHILSIPLASDGSALRSAEREFVDHANKSQSIDIINLGLMFITDRNCNYDLIYERYSLRNKGVEGMALLSQEEKQYVKDNLMKRQPDETIAMEAYASALDARKIALKIAEVIPDRLDFDNHQDYTPDQMIMSAGGAAAIMIWESSGGINKGSVPAINQINVSNPTFTEDVPSLHIVAEKMSQLLGISVPTERIPGAERAITGDPEIDANSSEGSIGITQVLPQTAKRLCDHFDEARKRRPDLNIPEYNPFDFTISLVGALIKVAEEVEIPLEDGTMDKRFGFRSGDSESERKSLIAWNRNSDEVEYIRTRENADPIRTTPSG